MNIKSKRNVELRLHCSCTILNHRFTQKLKLVGEIKFNIVSNINYIMFFILWDGGKDELCISTLCHN